MNRRSALKMGAAFSSLAALSPLSLVGRAVANAETDLGKVKVTGVKTASFRLGKYDTQLVKVETNSGIYGLGETYPQTAGALQNLEFIKKALIGQDPLQVEYLFYKMLALGNSNGKR